MKREELIAKLTECLDAGMCSDCKYNSSCSGYNTVLLDTLEYLECERAAEDEETKKYIDRIKIEKRGKK